MKKLLGAVYFVCALCLAGAAEKTTVTVMLEQDINTVKWLKEVKKAFEQKYPDVKLDLNIFSGKEADYYTKASLMLRSSDKIDVVFEDGFMLKSDVNAGFLCPIPVDQWTDWKEFYQPLRDFTTYDGKTYGIPLSTDTLGIYCSTSIFKKAGIETPWQPKNWNDILDAARKIKAKVPDVIPLSFPVAANGEATSMRTLELLLSGTDNWLFDKKWVLKSPGFLDALKFVDTVYKEKIGPELSVVLNPQYTSIISNSIAPKNKVAMFFDGCWAMGQWKEQHPETFKDYQFVPMPTMAGQAPGFTSMSGGWLMAISAKSKNKTGAFEFIKFALNKDNMLKYAQILNNLTVRQDVAAMSEYPAYMKGATSFLNFTHFRPASEIYPVVSPLIQKAVEAVATGHLTPEAAMDQYADAVAKIAGSDNIMAVEK